MVKLLVIADPVLPVPPTGYGGTERILFEVIKGLAERGYEITLLGHPDSRIPGKVIGYPDSRHRHKLIRGWTKWKFHQQLRTLLPQFDVVHAVCRVDYVLPALQRSIPTHYLFQNPIDPEQIDYLKQHTRGRLVLSGCGKQMTLAHQQWGHWRPIHNAVDVDRFKFHPQPRSPRYLAFLGRLTANKGVKEAIQVARQTNIPLHLAGNISKEPGGREYFEREIQPYIDGQSVIYLGEMNDAQKAEHLGGAIAFLNPVQWDEPFGIVTIEALACGTPVIACSRGELPYILEEGVTGYLCSSVKQMAEAVFKVELLDRERCRRSAVTRFSTPTMLQKYDEVYRWLLSSEAKTPEHWQLP